MKKGNSNKANYENWKPRSTKNSVGYRIEVSDCNVTCIPVLKQSEAVIIIK